MFMSESLTYLFLCVYFLTVSDDWKIVQIPNVAFMVMGLLFLCLMPESPRFLVSIKDFKKAREVFAWIGRRNGLKPSLIEERLAEIVFDGEEIGDRANSVIAKNLSVS